MLYFAYGSNLDWNQMKERCPSAQFVCRALIHDYRLAFTRQSKTRGCAVADIVPHKGSCVWGVVYQISDYDIGALDKNEGFQPNRKRDENAYVRENYHVYEEGNIEKPLSVTIYIANKQKNPPLPDDKYKKLIVEGAKFWHLPGDYVKELEQIKVAR